MWNVERRCALWNVALGVAISYCTCDLVICIVATYVQQLCTDYSACPISLGVKVSK